MCVVSNVGDYGRKSIPEKFPWVQPGASPFPPQDYTKSISDDLFKAPSRQEFEALKREVEELKKLLEAAKAYDEATNQVDCHQEEKVEFLKRIAEFVGVDLEEVFSNHK